MSNDLIRVSLMILLLINNSAKRKWWVGSSEYDSSEPDDFTIN